MRFNTYLLLSFLSPFFSTALGETVDFPCDFPFSFQHVVSAQLYVGKPLSPIPVPGGVLLVEPLVGGTITGPLLNGTIKGGVAHPSFYNNQTYQVPVLEAWGVTSDNQSFFINGAGAGTPLAQVTRLELSIGGSKYQVLDQGFLLATLNINANRTVVEVHGFLVTNILK